MISSNDFYLIANHLFHTVILFKVINDNDYFLNDYF